MRNVLRESERLVQRYSGVYNEMSKLQTPKLQLNEIGLDLSYHMEGLLRGTLEQIIEESRVRMLETVGRTEDAWQPYNLQTKSNLKSLLRDMEILGLDMSSQVTGDTWINLTQSTVNFCRHFLSVTESCAYLAKIETLKLNSEILLKDIFLAQHTIKPNPGITVDVSYKQTSHVIIMCSNMLFFFRFVCS